MPKYLSQHPVLQTLNSGSSFNTRYQVPRDTVEHVGRSAYVILYVIRHEMGRKILD